MSDNVVALQELLAEKKMPLAVLRVSESPRSVITPGYAVERTFCVSLSRETADRSIVAEAADPQNPAMKIPAAGEPHPDDARYLARPPLIHSVCKPGRTANFFNVRVSYDPPKEA